ncbi:gfo/Idh/MocA family oxidoreductase [Paraflavitalea soli]|uniref:Gfo/Idh/MocA family oxidoreductase n=1 Tax=Paraflavitalea soli TaxID=2315862 RepID=A0A3B7MV10_9BACT|nr:Gfo/Idh/MocA family oxidoreductase [Paraflavitalea soli]AXY78372.1 gfo/Idh/MocA family oxidoreductase [Paraflavitalea soli]
MDTFTWGIIGPGNIATEFAHDLDQIKSARHRIGAVLSHSLEKAAAFAEKEDAPRYFEDIGDFVKQAGVDAVYIATPHPLHHQETLRCLQHKLPVLCEKPLAMNSREVNEMVDAATKNQTFLMEGMWIRFLPSIGKVLSLLESKAIGKIISLKADMSYKAPHDPESRYFNPSLGGGSLLDLGIYPVFLTHLLLGKPTMIKATARLSDQHIDESCAAVFSYGNQGYALIESSLVTQTERTATIYGETGRIHIATPWNERPDRITVTIYDGSQIEYPCEWEGHGLQYEAEEVYHCIKQGKLYSDKLCHQFSLDLMATLDAIRRQTHITYPADKK